MSENKPFSPSQDHRFNNTRTKGSPRGAAAGNISPNPPKPQPLVRPVVPATEGTEREEATKPKGKPKGKAAK